MFSHFSATDSFYVPITKETKPKVSTVFARTLTNCSHRVLWTGYPSSKKASRERIVGPVWSLGLRFLLASVLISIAFFAVFVGSNLGKMSFNRDDFGEFGIVFWNSVGWVNMKGESDILKIAELIELEK